ncbi:MAG: PIN domain-containing protein [Acidobacteriota bacterium]
MGTDFLDTSYVIALASSRDAHHLKAIRLAEQIEQEGVQLVTTRGVLLEIGNALARARYREAAIALISSLHEDPAIEIVPASEDLCAGAFDLYRSRKDKEWGLTDCLSFVVMRELELNAALTADAHFQQAGLRALLLEP